MFQPLAPTTTTVTSTSCSSRVITGTTDASGQGVGGWRVTVHSGRCGLVEHSQFAEIFEAIQKGLLLLLGVGRQHLLGEPQTAPAATSAGVPL